MAAQFSYFTTSDDLREIVYHFVPRKTSYKPYSVKELRIMEDELLPAN